MQIVLLFLQFLAWFILGGLKGVNSVVDAWENYQKSFIQNLINKINETSNDWVKYLSSLMTP
jgi:hypothetical protein